MEKKSILYNQGEFEEGRAEPQMTLPFFYAFCGGR